MINLVAGSSSSVFEMINQYLHLVADQSLMKSWIIVLLMAPSLDKAEKLFNWKATHDLKFICTNPWRWQELL